MANVRISDLAAANTGAGGLIEIVQNGSSRKATATSIIYRSIGNNAGDVPLLTGVGTIPSTLGGTGLRLVANDSSQANSYLGYSAGVFGLHSLNIASVPDQSITLPKIANSFRASVADVLSPDPSNPKMVLTTSLATILTSIEARLAENWGDWATSTGANRTDAQIAAQSTLTLGTAPATAVINLISSTNISAKTRSMNAGQLDYYIGNNATLPAINPGTRRGVLVFVDSEDVRRAYIVANPENSDAQTAFHLDGDNWVADSYDDPDFYPNFGGLPEDSKWNLVSARASDGPPFGFFQDETLISRRIGGRNQALRIVFNDAVSPNVHAFSYTVRALSLPENSVNVPNLNTTNTGTDMQVLAQRVLQSGGAQIIRQLEWITVSGGGGGGLVIGGTKAAGKFLKATGVEANDQSWENINYTDLTVADAAIPVSKLAALAQNDIPNLDLSKLNVPAGALAGQAVVVNPERTGYIVSTITGGGSTPGTGSITSISQFASSMLANEEGVLSAGANNTSLVGNSTLNGILQDITSDHLWEAWSTASVTAQTTFPNSGNGGFWTNIPKLGGDGQIAAANASAFNAMTANIDGRPNVFGPSCSGLPNHTGTQRGALVIIDENNDRWALPIAEVPDGEATYQLVNNVWVPRGYRSDLLRIDFARIRSDDTRYEVFSSLALHGPTDNALRDEVLVARSDGRSQYALRVAYSTAQNRYEIVTADREAVFRLQDDEVMVDNLDASNAKAANKLVAVDDTDTNRFKFVDAPGLTTDMLFESNSNGGAGEGLGSFSLTSGKNFTNYDAIVLEACISTQPSVCYLSGMYVRALMTISSSGTEMTVGRHDVNQEINVRMSSNTQVQVTHADILRLKRVYGVNFG